MSRLLEMLIRHEGLKLKVYDDANGKEIVPGYTVKGNPTLGIGRNLIGKGISADEAKFLCLDDIADVRRQAAQFPWFQKLSSVRQDAICDMIFNLGIEGFKGFVHAIEFIEAGQFYAAADQLLKSKWADEVGSRATELAYMIEKDEYLEDEKATQS